MVFDNLKAFKLVFWDFDGVLFDSLAIKGRAFADYFSQRDSIIWEKIYGHHIANGGMPRSEKLPLYSLWSGIERWDDFNAFLFSRLSEEANFNPEALVAVRELHNSRVPQCIVSAALQSEVVALCETACISYMFDQILGAPAVKTQLIGRMLTSYRVPHHDAILVGDSNADHQAANACGIPFLYYKCG